jgi:hypothetical protein
MAVKNAWIVDVAISKSAENIKRVVTLVNTAFANLGGDIGEFSITEEDVASLSAEWTAIKSDANMNRSLVQRAC